MLATVAVYSYIIFYPYSSDPSGGLTPLSDTGVLNIFSLNLNSISRLRDFKRRDFLRTLGALVLSPCFCCLDCSAALPLSLSPVPCHGFHNSMTCLSTEHLAAVQCFFSINVSILLSV